MYIPDMQGLMYKMYESAEWCWDKTADTHASILYHK